MIESDHFGYHVNEYIEKEYHLKYENSSATQMERFCMGLDKGLTLIGSRPFMGGSVFATSMALELAQTFARVLYITRENHNIPEILCHNYISTKLGNNFPIPPSTQGDIAKYNALTHEMTKVHLYCKGSSYFCNLDELKTFLYEEVGRHGTQYIFIDCIQDLRVDSEQCVGMTTEEYICRELRDISFQMDIRIIALANLNPIPEGPDRWGRVFVPHIGDFKGGDLALYATKVYLLNRPEYYHVFASEYGEDFKDKLYVYIGGSSSDEVDYTFTFDSKNMKVH